MDFMDVPGLNHLRCDTTLGGASAGNVSEYVNTYILVIYLNAVYVYIICIYGSRKGHQYNYV